MAAHLEAPLGFLIAVHDLTLVDDVQEFSLLLVHQVWLNLETLDRDPLQFEVDVQSQQAT